MPTSTLQSEPRLTRAVQRLNLTLLLSTYIESTSESLESTRDFIQKMRAIYPTDTPTHLKLVAPCITPRFIPTCSKELLSGLGAMAKEENVDIQSHLSESSDEVAFTKSIWGDREDAEIFQEVRFTFSSSVIDTDALLTDGPPHVESAFRALHSSHATDPGSHQRPRLIHLTLSAVQYVLLRSSIPDARSNVITSESRPWV